MGPLKRLWQWFDERTGAAKAIGPLARHPVPPGTATGKTGWLYVTGAGTLAAFIVQVATGTALATKYIPSTAHAYDSLQFITNEVTLGRMLRGMHYFGASAMVVFVFLHLIRVFLTGSYKFPREVNWLTGVLLLVLTLSMAWTGQLLRWDQNGVWSVVVGAKFAARTPLIGGPFANFILGGETVGGTTLSRFFSFHVFFFPALIFAFVGLHLYLVIHHGISEPPEAGRPVDPQTYRDWYQALLKRAGRPHWPDAAWRETLVGVGTIAVIALLAFAVGPRELSGPPDPTMLVADPRPDWYFLWYYALLAYKPRGLETFVMVYLPLLAGLILLLLPFVAPRGERSLKHRPWAIVAVLVPAIALGGLTLAGLRAPWVPAFATEPLPPQVAGATSNQVREGTRLFYTEGCQYCHAVAGQGGRYGPDLTNVAKRLPPQEITFRIHNGIGDMPAYGDILTPEELQAIVAFLAALPDSDVGATGSAGAGDERDARR